MYYIMIVRTLYVYIIALVIPQMNANLTTIVLSWSWKPTSKLVIDLFYASCLRKKVIFEMFKELRVPQNGWCLELSNSLCIYKYALCFSIVEALRFHVSSSQLASFSRPTCRRITTQLLSLLSSVKGTQAYLTKHKLKCQVILAITILTKSYYV